MDGYALPDDGDEKGEYRLLETVHAGETGRLPLRPGTAVQVMTGAPGPGGDRPRGHGGARRGTGRPRADPERAGRHERLPPR